MIRLISKILFFIQFTLLVFLCSGCTAKQSVPESALAQDSSLTVIEEKVEASTLEVAIVMSSQAEAYRLVADSLISNNRHHFNVVVLENDDVKNNIIIDALLSQGFEYIIALGLPAARYLSQAEHNKIVFAQVFNFQLYDLVKDNVKGISVLPLPEELFGFWKKLSPELNQVAVITGDGLEDYIAEAKQAAQQQGVDLVHITASNDKEFLYHAKNKLATVQGYWFLPDNRILSSRVLKDIMAFASRRARQVVVFSPGLLVYGGLISIEPSADGIAAAIIKRIDESKDRDDIPGADVASVSKSNIYINGIISGQLGLVIDDAMKQFVYK